MEVKKSIFEKVYNGFYNALAARLGARWGAAIAGAITGAIIGVLCALGALTLTDCTGSITQSASGDLSAQWELKPLPINSVK